MKELGNNFEEEERRKCLRFDFNFEEKEIKGESFSSLLFQDSK